VHVFAQVDALGLNVGIQFFEGGDLLGHRVAAIINQNVNTRNAFAHDREEISVGLVADYDCGTGILKLPARWIDVDADNPSLRTKIMVPHRQ